MGCNCGSRPAGFGAFTPARTYGPGPGGPGRPFGAFTPTEDVPLLYIGPQPDLIDINTGLPVPRAGKSMPWWGWLAVAGGLGAIGLGVAGGRKGRR